MFNTQLGGLTRTVANKASVPKSPVTGMNTKTVGRVAPVDSVKQPVNKTAAERASVERKTVEKQAAEKTVASIGSIMGSDAARAFGANVAGGLGAVAAVGLANAVTHKVNDMRASSKYKSSLAKAISINPRLQQRPRAELEQYLELISEASPSVARNPLLLANYLEFLLDHQGQLNYQAYTNLVNLEGSILSNRSSANPLTSQVQKAIVDASVRGAFDNYAKIDKADIASKARAEGHRAGMNAAWEAFANNP